MGGGGGGDSYRWTEPAAMAQTIACFTNSLWQLQVPIMKYWTRTSSLGEEVRAASFSQEICMSQESASLKKVRVVDKGLILKV